MAAISAKHVRTPGLLRAVAASGAAHGLRDTSRLLSSHLSAGGAQRHGRLRPWADKLAVPPALSVHRAVSSTAPTVAASARIGEQVHGWTCERVEEIQELSCQGILWRHKKTQAELLSVEQPLDENKTFGISFRTPPEKSDGIAHILEHSVLCGSRKYPVKEPFTELLKGSLQTFLNAMTFPDRTCYPVASCNLQDFYNLTDVYLDAVFYPRARQDQRILAQEGWHYEAEAKGAPLTYKGVVFNEMKGVYSNPDSVQGRTLLSNLLPDTPYARDSGGDPHDIVNLTFDEFKAFYDRFYHPSNAKFWFYGDDPPTRRLQLLDEYLRDFEARDAHSEIPLQPLWQKPRRVEHRFAVGKDEDASKKAMACMSWVLSEDKPALEEYLALSVLNYCLMGRPGAPLRKALTDSGLGSQVIGGGLYDGLVQPTFSVGLKDIREADVSKVEDMILKTLEEVAAKGFEHESVEAAVNKIEFMNREMNTGGVPRGLSLMFSAVSNWNYGKDPFEGLRFAAPLMSLREKLVIQRQPMLEDLVRRKLLRNNHRLLVVSKPDAQEGDRLEAVEKDRLEAHQRTLSDAEFEHLVVATKELKEFQEASDKPEDLAKVPRLDVQHIPKDSLKIPTDVGQLGVAEVLKHTLLTSGVVYVDVAFDLRDVPSDLLPLLPLFCRALTEMGTKKSDFVKLQRRMDLATGGIRASVMVSSRRSSADPVAFLVLRGKAMDNKVDNLSDLMGEIVSEVTWENGDRFLQLAKEAHASGRSQLLSSGHNVASGRISRQLTTAGWVNEQMSGLSQFQALSSIIKSSENEWPQVEAKLRALQAHIFKKKCILNVTADAPVVASIDSHLESFLSRLPKGAAVSPYWTPQFDIGNEGIIVPSQVNYVGKGANLYKHGYKLHASSVVTSRLLGTTWLWDRIRVSGGAYGGFCNFDIRSGDFKYLSYRDPNLDKTLANYDETPEFLRALEVNADMLAKGIVGTMGDVDKHQLPDAKGYTALMRHMRGESDEMRQELRDQILSTTGDDIRNFADALATVRTGHVCVVGGEEAIRGSASAFNLKLCNPFAAP